MGLVDMSPENTWRDRHGLTLSQCVKCRYWLKEGRCKAFPDGVPLAILDNTFDHTKRFGDESLLFAPIET